MHMITNSSKARLTCKQAAEFLTERGFPTSPATLDTVVSRPGERGGPVYSKWGRRRLYDRDDLLAWAEAKLGPKRCNFSETSHG